MVGTSPLDTSWTCVMKGIAGPVTDITLGSRLQSKARPGKGSQSLQKRCWFQYPWQCERWADIAARASCS